MRRPSAWWNGGNILVTFLSCDVRYPSLFRLVIQCRSCSRTLKDGHLLPQRLCCFVDLSLLVNTSYCLQGASAAFGGCSDETFILKRVEHCIEVRDDIPTRERCVLQSAGD